MALTGKLAEWAKKGKNVWKAEREEMANSSGSNIDDGVYDTRLVYAKVDEAQSGRVQLCTRYLIVQGELAKKTIYNYDGMENMEQGKSLKTLARFLKRFGIKLDDVNLEDINEILDGIVKTKPYVQVKKSTNGDFQNVWVQKVYGEDWEPTEGLTGDPYVEETGSSGASGDGPTAEVGMEVEYAWKDGTEKGVIVALHADTSQITVKNEKGKERKIAAADAVLPEPPKPEPTADKPKKDKKKKNKTA